jgi:hypothetical protein
VIRLESNVDISHFLLSDCATSGLTAPPLDVAVTVARGARVVGVAVTTASLGTA